MENCKVELATGGQNLKEVKNPKRHLPPTLTLTVSVRYFMILPKYISQKYTGSFMFTKLQK